MPDIPSTDTARSQRSRTGVEEWVAGQLELGGIAANLRYVPNMMNKTAARTWPGRDRAEAGRGRKAVKSHDSQDKTRQDQIRPGQVIALGI